MKNAWMDFGSLCKWLMQSCSLKYRQWYFILQKSEWKVPDIDKIVKSHKFRNKHFQKRTITIQCDQSGNSSSGNIEF